MIILELDFARPLCKIFVFWGETEEGYVVHQLKIVP